MSFGDCLPEEGVPGRGVCKLTNCKLTAKSALMVVLSLATSAAYFGCKHGHVRWKLPFKCSIETSIRQFRWLCRQSRPDPAHRRALARGKRARRPPPVVRSGWQYQRDGHAIDAPPAARFFAGGAKFDAAVDFTISGSSNATESVPCILQVRDDAFMPELRRITAWKLPWELSMIRTFTGKMLMPAGLIAAIL